MQKDPEPFKLSKGAEKAIELLNDKMYLKKFYDENPQSEDIILPYKIFMLMVNNKELNFYNKNYSNEEIWKMISICLTSKSDGKLGIFLM